MGEASEVDALPRSRTGSRTGESSRSGAWAFSFLGLGFEKAGRVIACFVVARFLSGDAFGAFLLTLVTINTIGGILGGGLNSSAVHFISGAAEEGEERLSRSFFALAVWALGVACVLALLSVWPGPSWLAERVLLRHDMALPLAIACVAIVMFVLSQCGEGMLHGMRQFRTVSFVKMSAAPLTIAAIVGLGIRFGLAGAVWGLVGGVGWCTVAFVVGALRSARRRGLRCRRAPGRFVLTVGRMAGMVALSNVMAAMTVWAAHVILTRESGLTSVGLFGAASQLRNLVALIPATLGIATLPFLSRASVQGDWDRLRAIATEYCMLVFAVVGPACVFFLGMSREVLTFCYGAGKSPAWPAANLLFWGQLALMPGLVMAYVVIARDEVVYGVAANLLWASIYLALGWILASGRAHVGLAAAMLTASVIQAPVCVAYLAVRRAARIGRILPPLGIVLFCAACSQAGTLLPLPAMRFMVSLFAAGAGFAGVWFFGFRAEERCRVTGKIRSVLHGIR